MADRYDVIIIGGGLIGSSIAWRLTQESNVRIAVLDVDLTGHFSSSELNAGICRTLWSSQINTEMAVHSINFYEAIKEEVGFKQRGITWLVNQDTYKAMVSSIEASRKAGATVHEICPEEFAGRYPEPHNTSQVHTAIACPKDGVINANSLKHYYRARAQAGGAVFLDHHQVVGVNVGSGGSLFVKVNVFSPNDDCCEQIAGKILGSQKTPSGAQEKTFVTTTLVNAAGAWSGKVSSLWREDSPAQPVRHQLSLIQCKDMDFGRSGVVVSPEGLYWRPEAGMILAGYSKPGAPGTFCFKYDSSFFFSTEIQPRLIRSMDCFEKSKHMGGWAGLYGVTPDNNGLLGRSPVNPGVFHASCFTGRGVVCSYAVGVAAAEMIINGKCTTFDVTPLDPKRFHGPQGEELEGKETPGGPGGILPDPAAAAGPGPAEWLLL